MNMLRLFKQSLVASLLLCVSAASSANLLVNGSFEDPVVSTPLYFTNTPFSFSGWSGLAAANEFRRGDVAIVPGSSFGLAPADGNQAFCFNVGNPPAGSYIEQNITTGLLQVDRLSFDIGRDITSTQALTLRVDMYSGTNSPPFSTTLFSPPATAGYALYALAFNNSFSTTTRIRFTDASDSNPDTDLLLDNVSVTVLGAPEPSASALLVAFTAVLGLRRVRRVPQHI
jgi:hypothetical protein